MSDLGQQLQMLRHLQTLVGGQKDQPREFSGFDLEQLNQLQQFGGEVPENLLPLLNNIPPNVVRNVLSDPDARQQIQQLLQQYAKDRQLPRGGSGSNMPLLPPSKDNPSSNRPSQNRPSGNPPSSSGQKQQPPEPEQDIDQSDDVLKKALEGVMKKFSNLQQAEDPSSANRPSTSPSHQQPANDGDTQDSWSDVLDKLIEQDRKFREGDTTSTEVGNDQPSAEAQSGTGSRSPNNAGSGTDSPSKTVAEYLKELKNRPLPPVPNRPPTSPQTRRSPGKPGDISHQTSSAPDESAVAREQLKQDAKSSLQRRGLKETLRRIARDARQQIRSSGSAGSPGDAATGSQTGARSGSSAGLERALIRALDGLREDIVEIAKDAKFKRSSSGNGSQATGRPTKSRSDSDSGMRSFGRSAGNFLSDLTTTRASSKNSSASTPVGVSDAVTENVFGLLTLLALLGIVALFAWKSGLLATPFGDPAYGPPVRAVDVRTKHDVVNAFHNMALQPSRQVQRWWTHRKVADHMLQDRPEHIQAVKVLTELYEQARYLPEETEFSQEQIQSARQALKQCESC
ncbi:MAG TPA: DUF4129 domain-containing protein [Planctomycetes bacterium]|nr:DUF4129 domain-containing protein [Fuerstiella sp.]HIK90491.1 DUF4129 domain-containing protein [Planctomycetota bacterium]